MTRLKEVNPFYTLIKWRHKRERILKRDEYLCQECKRYGKSKAAEQVHHINPLEEYPELAWCSDNLISLCNSCHDKMHNRDNNTLTKAGLRWVCKVESKLQGIKHIPPG